jgi:hypothetical protein
MSSLLSSPTLPRVQKFKSLATKTRQRLVLLGLSSSFDKKLVDCVQSCLEERVDNVKSFKKLYDEYIFLPRLCEEGFAQTGFNDYVHVEHKAALVPDDQVTNEYVGQFLDGNGGVLRAYTNILTADWMDVQIRTLSTPSAWATQRQREQNGFGIGALGCFAKRSRTRI